MIAIAALEERAQSFSLRRTVSISDFLADVLGIFLGSWLVKYLVERYGETSGAK
jgi:VanZ family protein